MIMAEFDEILDPGQEENDKRLGGVIKAAEKNDFEPWQEDPLPAKSGLTAARQTIIKGSRVETGSRRIINPEIPSLHSSDQMKAEQIVEDGAIVGIRMLCRCGAKHKILFDYE